MQDAWSCKALWSMHESYSGLGVLSAGVLTSVVGLDGPVIGTVLPVDLVVL